MHHRRRGAALRLLLVVAAAATEQPGTLEARVLEAMRTSVTQYAQCTTKEEAIKAVRAVFKAPSDTDPKELGRVLVLNGRVFADRHDHKVYGHLVTTAAALQESNSVGSLAYLHESGASGHCAKKRPHGYVDDLPTTLIARDGYANDTCGVLVPNPYFGTLSHHEKEERTLVAAAAQSPYTKRDPRAFWRGHVNKMHVPYENATAPLLERELKLRRYCEKELGNVARFRGALLTVEKPQLFDIKAQKVDGDLWFNKKQFDRHECTRELHVPPKVFAKFKAKGVEAKHYLPKEYARYKILAHFPGGTSGSYSRNLNYLWAMGSAIMVWAHPAVEWYYVGLEDGVSHVVFNATTAVDVARRITQEPVSARLRAGAARVQRELTCARCLNRYLLATLEALRMRFRGDLALGGRDTARATLKGVDCSGLDLVEYVRDDAMTLGGKKLHGLKVLPPATTRPRAGEDVRCLAVLDAAFPDKNATTRGRGRSLGAAAAAFLG